MSGVKPISVPQPLAYAIDQAGAKSAVDFDYLLQTAARESSLNPAAKARSSSATGLFQFLDSTWLRVMKQEGPRLGYQAYADAISVSADGDYSVADPETRAAILKLREDPQVSADLAAAFTADNGAYLQSKFGRMPSPGELYIAHFLGAQGAEKLFRAGLADPDQSAAALFPRQAKANPTIFYRDGAPRSVREVYKVLTAQQASLTPETNSTFLAQQLADSGSTKWQADAVPSRFGPSDLSFASLFSNEASIPGRTLLSPATEAAGAGLFDSLYGQGGAPIPGANGD
jgi:hypothetical protein